MPKQAAKIDINFEKINFKMRMKENSHEISMKKNFACIPTIFLEK
jgi:hypothetical protein